jgi:hypothetical protein
MTTRSLGFGPTVFASNAFPQQEVLQHKLRFLPREWTTTDLAGYLAIGCLKPSFDFDHLVKSFAVRACEWIERASCHNTPPTEPILKS